MPRSLVRTGAKLGDGGFEDEGISGVDGIADGEGEGDGDGCGCAACRCKCRS